MKFRDGLAAGVVTGCFLIAIGEGLGILQTPDFILGVIFTVGFTLVIQFFFRKKPEKG